MEDYSFLKYYQELKPFLSPIFHIRADKSNLLKVHTVAAFSKCFEFNLFSNEGTSLTHSFFYCPALRGICEDLIALSFFKKRNLPNTNEILLAYNHLRVVEMAGIQHEYFKKNHAQQIVFHYEDAERVYKENQHILNAAWKKSGFKSDTILPSVRHMATDSGLTDLYNYVYAATSDMVHFSPHNLMRMGWGSNTDKSLLHFSTEHFNKYYAQFNRFYGSLLFIKFSETFRKDLALPKEAITIIKDLEETLFIHSRWPEIITFEEMNVSQAEDIRRENAIRKLRILAKEHNLSEQETESSIQDLLHKIKKGG